MSGLCGAVVEDVLQVVLLSPLAALVWLAGAHHREALRTQLEEGRSGSFFLGRDPSWPGVLLVPGRVVQVHPGHVADVAIAPCPSVCGDEAS